MRTYIVNENQLKKLDELIFKIRNEAKRGEVRGKKIETFGFKMQQIVSKIQYQ